MLLGLWFGFDVRHRCLGFYSLFAIAVTASVQLVVVYLGFASLNLPALATRLLHNKRRLISGYTIGLISYALGLALSALFDLPSGAIIVWMLAIVAFIFSNFIKDKTST